MDANDFGGHTGGLPRLFSIPTLVIGINMFLSISGSNFVPGIYPDPDTALQIGAIATPLGLHGVLTNTARVGIIRKFFSYASGVAGGIILYKAFIG
ncbi:hypothetical protein [Roseibium sp.]|uniref:hypothetical protein n=1 Tax=Roseibium sp. TaxID=1936156 RepID=UPI003A97BA05